MEKIQIKSLSTGASLPVYGSKNSAGADLRAIHEYLIPAQSRVLVKTGIAMALPVGYEAQVRPRSGLAIKHGITVLNTPGTIDEDYRGEVGVVLINHSFDNFVINKGDRIAQLVIKKYEQFEFEWVDELSETDRGADGFGSTGVQ